MIIMLLILFFLPESFPSYSSLLFQWLSPHLLQDFANVILSLMFFLTSQLKIVNLLIWWSVLTRCLFSVVLLIRSHDSQVEATLHWAKSLASNKCFFLKVLYQIGFSYIHHLCEPCPTSGINHEWVGDISCYLIWENTDVLFTGMSVTTVACT